MKNKHLFLFRPYGLFLAALCLYFFFPISSFAENTVQPTTTEAKIGVLALRGKEKCLQQWNATAEYLSQKIPGRSFTIVPLDFDEMPKVVGEGQVDFVVTNSSMYVSLESHYGITHIATMKTKMLDLGLTKFGGVIFCRSDRDDIQSINDLPGKRLMAVDKKSFGGWQMTWALLLDHDIDPEKDLKELVFGGTHNAVVLAVLNKTVDAGTVRTSTLEKMAKEGKIRLDQFRVLEDKSQTSPDFPFLHTTALYPEWPFTKVSHTDEELARKVAIALLQLQPADGAAMAAEMMGWTIPLDYQSVHECLKKIKFDPYDVVQHITVRQLLHHWPGIMGIFLFLILACGATLYFLRLNQRLRQTMTVLDHELAQRKQIEKTLKGSHADLDQIFNSAADGMRLINLNNEIMNVNNTFARLVGLPKDQLIGKKCYEVFPGTECHTNNCPLHLIRNGVERVEYETEKFKSDGALATCLVVATPFYNASGELKGIIEYFRDITDRRKAEKEQQKLHSQLLHAQKLESVGQLAAGIAHEINTPTQYIGTNIDFLADGFKDVVALIAAYQRLLTAEKNQQVSPALIQEIEETLAAADWDYLAQELPLALAQSKDGVQRISSIVRAMKEFSHPGNKEKIPLSLNKLINTTVTVSRNEWKYVADLETDFADDLPLVPCLSNEMGQVFLNLLVNAAHAIATKLGGNPSGPKGHITISTRLAGDQVEIRLQDTGCGIPEDILSKVFDPFFTTKDVGKGTGQGLAIARDVIVNKHDGTLEVESAPGQGATFIIRLPIASV
ncbi:MAG: PhnD/SsuA/transferrin family substrate-binding protein [Desulfocapsaceae bacterium]|nr:PhnD/SsuA/transferrin family substrate-binding protein [Desulfocapsaceae bacterium]